ncbi:MAG: hypothetical protein QOJ65_1019 [Fimbriimonadaceae bacterium]|jgi:hypothetical protein|nr:hypothetical protein [Fimbriimonadaceae bacterium]
MSHSAGMTGVEALKTSGDAKNAGDETVFSIRNLPEQQFRSTTELEAQ